MNTLVVYESVYGNTRAVAEAIAEGLGGAEIVPVHEAPKLLDDAVLLIIGGPTHMHGMTTTRSRQLAAEAVREDGAGTSSRGLPWSQACALGSATCRNVGADARRPSIPGSTDRLGLPGSPRAGSPSACAAVAMSFSAPRASWSRIPRVRSRRESWIELAPGARSWPGRCPRPARRHHDPLVACRLVHSRSARRP